MNTQILFRSRPAAEPHESNFRKVQHGVPTSLPGEVVCRTIYLSVDPYMRVRMYDEASYVEPMDFGDVMVGATIGQVVESQDDEFQKGDYVVGMGGWQSYWLTEGPNLRKVDPATVPLSAFLGVLGMPGLTAWVSIEDIGLPKEGETVVVSAAAGAVGSVAGQLAKKRGARVVGIAGTKEKCRWVCEDLGFDACINYKDLDLDKALGKECPDGVDLYLENVGGPVGETVYRHLAIGGRVVLIGLIAHYNERKHHTGPSLEAILFRRATVRGMIVRDHAHRREEFERKMSSWLGDGTIKYRETVTEGLDNAAHALIGLFHGKNIGKAIVKVGGE